MPTLSDFFCGAGGSSTGAKAAGFEVRIAVNHWALAIETHNTNHPETDHYLDDIQAAHPSRYPRTDVLWMSPECTSHSIAKGRKRKGLGQLDLWGENKIDPAEERSRATMREVVEFTAHHRYEYVIVENVVDIRNWMHYDTWWTAMLNLGYEGRVLYLNSQFFGVPQSRDRYYAVFWKKGNRAPNLDFKPAAWCLKCEASIESIQVFKKHPNWGRYGTKRQYTYRCPTCGSEVYPPTQAAASVIDWSDLGTVIGERNKGLKPKTMARIRAGLKKFTRPFIAPMRGTANPHDVLDPLTTIIASAQQQPLITGPFITDTLFTHSDSDRNVSVDDPLRTLTSRQSLALVSNPFIMSYYGREDAQSDLNAPLPVIPTEPRHSLVLPPWITSFYKTDCGHDIQHPIPTITTEPHHGLITPPFISCYNSSGDGQPTTLDNPLWTITTVDRLGLTIPPESLNPKDLDEMAYWSRFRMLNPIELKLGMGFRMSYVVLGTQREQVQQEGNAVIPIMAEALCGRVLEAMVA